MNILINVYVQLIKIETPLLQLRKKRIEYYYIVLLGCTTKDVLNAVYLTEKDLFNNKTVKTIEKEYIYTDEESRILYKVIRYHPKRFSQAQYLNGRWENNMNNVKHVPYNLPNIVKNDIIYWVEGEKDADNLNSIGLVATTTVGGSSGFNKYKKEYCKYFKNKIIYILPDNDEAGKKYAESIYKALSPITNRIKILDLKNGIDYLEDKQDISDILEKYGKDKTLEILENLTSTDNDLFDFSGQILSKELLENILKYLNINISYNEITKDIDIIGLPSEYSAENAETTLPIYLKEQLKKYKIKGTKKEIEDLLILLFDINRYNPIIDMLTNNKWDKIDRFNTLYEIMGVTDSFEQTLIRKWFRQTVSIAFNGYNHTKPYGIEGVLTLQGPEASGKTTFARNIAMKSEWFTEGASVDLKSKDSIILASKGWIVELGELDSTAKRKQSDLKAFLLNTMDEIRVPYGRKGIKKPRRTSFIATVNPSEFLNESTGNRRFWTISVKNIDNKRLEKLGDDWIKQLWLQAYNEVKNDFQSFRLTSEEREELIRRNYNHTELTTCEEELALLMNFSGNLKEKWTSTEINEELLDKKYDAVRIGKAISKLKLKYPNYIEVKTVNGVKKYILPIKKTSSSGSSKK